jgi:hypothetical protein
MAFSGSPIITSAGKSALIDKFESDAVSVTVRLTYIDSSDGDTSKFATSSALTMSWGSSAISIDASSLNVEFSIDEGDEVTKAELRYTDSSGTTTLDEYTESGAVYTYGGKYVVTGWTLTLTGSV